MPSSCVMCLTICLCPELRLQERPVSLAFRSAGPWVRVIILSGLVGALTSIQGW